MYLKNLKDLCFYCVNFAWVQLKKINFFFLHKDSKNLHAVSLGHKKVQYRICLVSGLRVLPEIKLTI